MTIKHFEASNYNIELEYKIGYPLKKARMVNIGLKQLSV